METIWLYNPETEGLFETTPEAFEEAWEPLGWVRASTDEDGNPCPPSGAAPTKAAKATTSGTGPDTAAT